MRRVGKIIVACLVMTTARVAYGANAKLPFFGMIINHLVVDPPLTPWPTPDSFSSLRMWSAGVTWADIQPTNRSSYVWTNFDALVNLATSHGKDILYTFGSTPPWAIAQNVAIQSVSRTNQIVTVVVAAPDNLQYRVGQSTQPIVTLRGVTDPSFDGTFVLTGTPTPTTLTFEQTGPDASSSGGTYSDVCTGVMVPEGCAEPPYQMSDWDNFVTAIATRSNGRIRYWEMWNEASLPPYWKGTNATLITMTQHARSIIKAIDPNAVIISPSAQGVDSAASACHSDPKCGATWMDSWLSQGGKNYVDIVAFHNYPSQNNPELVVGRINNERTALADNGLENLPIWDTESSWGTDTQIEDSATQVAFLMRHLILQMAAGVQRSYWYAFDNTVTGTLWWSSQQPGPNGLVGLTAAGSAYNALVGWLQGATFPSPCTTVTADTTTWSCSLTLSDGTSAETVWNTSTTKSYSLPPSFTRYKTIDGQTHPISNNVVSISLQPILLMGAATQSPVSTVGGFSNVRVYPNPWRKDQDDGYPVTFDHMPARSDVKIFTVSGHKVKELDAGNGSAIWDLTDTHGDLVASGIYIYLIKNSQSDTTKGKLAVIR